MEDSKIILSIIVPVYNVERYVRKCVDSLLNQDIDNYEIILVDDGSTDKSGAICDEYAASSLSAAGTSPFNEADHFIIPIRVIHQPNAGLSAARNAGIKCANGTYLMFVDSDDYIEPNVLAGLMAQVERDNLDVLRFKYQNVNEKCEVFNPYKSDSRRNDNYSDEVTDGITFMNTRFGTNCYVSMFIVHCALLDNCLFAEGIYFEDTDWTPRMLAKANRVASTNTVVYNYMSRMGSITHATELSKQKKILDDKMQLIKSLQKQSADIQSAGKLCTWFDRMIADNVISIISILGIQFYQEKMVYLKQLREMNVYPILSRIAKARLINLSPRLAVELLHIRNRQKKIKW